MHTLIIKKRVISVKSIIHTFYTIKKRVLIWNKVQLPNGPSRTPQPCPGHFVRIVLKVCAAFLHFRLHPKRYRGSQACINKHFVALKAAVSFPTFLQRNPCRLSTVCHWNGTEWMKRLHGPPWNSANCNPLWPQGRNTVRYGTFGFNFIHKKSNVGLIVSMLWVC